MPTKQQKIQLGKMSLSAQAHSKGQRVSNGSSSLKECIELLNTATKIAPAPLDSGVGKKSPDPLQNAHLLIAQEGRWDLSLKAVTFIRILGIQLEPACHHSFHPESESPLR